MGLPTRLGLFHTSTGRGDLATTNTQFERQSSLGSSSSRRISRSFDVEIGEFYNGNRSGVAFEATFKPTVKISIEPTVDFNRITLPDMIFHANAYGGRIGYSFSTTFFTKLFAQWSSDEDVLSANFLLNYIYRPGSDLYIVFNQNYGIDGGNFEALDWTVIGKITFWWNP